MKNNFILTLTALLMSIAIHGQKLVKTYYDPWSETKIKEKYSVDRENRKNGKYTKYDKRGLVALEVNYVNGQPNGEVKEYFLPAYGFPGDEKLKIVANYVDGSKQGTVKQFVYLTDGDEDLSDGNRFLYIQGEYNNDNIEREQKWWYNGHKRYDVREGEGKSTFWYKNGNKESEYSLKDGRYEGLMTEWYLDGTKKMEAQYSNGKVHGEKSQYFETGELMKTETYINGDLNGLITTYSKNGNKIIESSYKNGTLSGDYKKWYEDGNLKMHGLIEEGKKQGGWSYYDKAGNETTGEYKADDKIGEWRVYYTDDWEETIDVENAAYYREIFYVENEKPDTTRRTSDFYINGSKKFEGFVISENPDIFDKFCTFYYESGTIKSEGNYKLGHQLGKWIDYYENGNLKEIYFLKKKPTESNGYGQRIVVGGEQNSRESSGKYWRSGYTFYYNENGVNTKTEYYLNGELSNTFEGKKSLKLDKKYRDDPNQTRLF